MEATWSRSATHALLFLRRVLERCTNKPLFVVDRGPWHGWAFGIRSRIERYFRILRRTKVFANNVNARRLHIRALNIILLIFLSSDVLQLAQAQQGDRGISAIAARGGGLRRPISHSLLIVKLNN